MQEQIKKTFDHKEQFKKENKNYNTSFKASSEPTVDHTFHPQILTMVLYRNIKKYKQKIY